MNYIRLGKLSNDFISFFRESILELQKTGKFQWIHFNAELNREFLKYFVNDDLEINWNPASGLPIQKAFYSEPGSGFRIHKDGKDAKCALNIALQCNASDWVRWYSNEHINALMNNREVLNTSVKKSVFDYSRNVEIMDYESIEYIDELHAETGEAYLVNTDVFHSFKCNGPLTRIILQTKFKGNPDIETAYNSLKNKSFNNLIN